MTNPHTTRVSSDTYQKAVKYLPEHWVMVLRIKREYVKDIIDHLLR